MEYNAENVMMGLRSCTRGRKSNDDRPCIECPYEECNIVGGTSERQTKGTCQGWLMKDALALLREKDKEIERYSKIVGDLVIRDGEVVGIIDGKETRYIDKSVSNVLKTMAVNRVKADTVRKMHSEIKERCIKGGIYPAFVASTIDKIATEMLEES